MIQRNTTAAVVTSSSQKEGVVLPNPMALDFRAIDFRAIEMTDEQPFPKTRETYSPLLSPISSSSFAPLPIA